MTRTLNRRSRLLSGTALAVVLAACGGGGGSGGSAGSGPAESSTPDVPASGGDQPQFGSEEFGLTKEELAVRIEQVEVTIAECMAQAGFEYVPVDYTTVQNAMNSDGSAPGVSDDDYIAQYGFGITTQFDDPVVELGKGEQNVAIYAALASSDQVAYVRALWGENPEATFARAMEDEDFSETGGCTRAAVEENFSGDELNSSYINPGDVLIEQDRRVIAALEAWSGCMRDAGYEYGHPDDVTDDLQEQLDAVLGGADPATLEGPAKDALTELQGYERAVAAVTSECESEHVEPMVAQVESEIYGSPQA